MDSPLARCALSSDPDKSLAKLVAAVATGSFSSSLMSAAEVNIMHADEQLLITHSLKPFLTERLGTDIVFEVSLIVSP